MLNKLNKDFTTIWISFENLKTASKAEFYQALNHKLHRGLKNKAQSELIIHSAISLDQFFENTSDKSKAIVLVIDEFEGIPDCVLSEVMHTFRQIYHQKEYYDLHSLILVGVSTIAELVVSSASPFNIAEEL